MILNPFRKKIQLLGLKKDLITKLPSEPSALPDWNTEANESWSCLSFLFCCHFFFYDSLVLSCMFVRKGLINPNHSLFS